MDDLHSQLKSFIDKHPDVISIQMKYSNANYIVLSIRCLDTRPTLDKDSGIMKENSKAISYEDLDLSRFSENENYGFMRMLSMMYYECQHLE